MKVISLSKRSVAWRRLGAFLVMALVCYYFTHKVWQELCCESLPDDNMTLILEKDLRRRPIYQYQREANFDKESHLASLRETQHSMKPKTNCPALFLGDYKEQKLARRYMQQHPAHILREEDYLMLTKRCGDFRGKLGYIMVPLSDEEYHFPLAYSILAYRDISQTEKLLRAIYMPQNVYCIHVDRKASPSFLQAVRAIANCFPNVFVPTRTTSVYWGHISVVDAEMNCMRDLVNYRWRYYINLSAQMYPLKTNAEIVRILKLFGGANDLEGIQQESLGISFYFRTALRWALVNIDGSDHNMYPTPLIKAAPPYKVQIIKGCNNGALSREFVLYLLHSQVANDIYRWAINIFAPDEYIWQTLNHNSHLKAPGSYTGFPDTKPFISRVSIWEPKAKQKQWSWKHWDCQGKWVRMICIFGIGDLPWLTERPELFANKFHSDFEYLTLDCMEQWHVSRTLNGSSWHLDLDYYRQLPFVKNPDLIYRPLVPPR